MEKLFLLVAILCVTGNPLYATDDDSEEKFNSVGWSVEPRSLYNPDEKKFFEDLFPILDRAEKFPSDRTRVKNFQDEVRRMNENKKIKDKEDERYIMAQLGYIHWEVVGYYKSYVDTLTSIRFDIERVKQLLKGKLKLQGKKNKDTKDKAQQDLNALINLWNTGEKVVKCRYNNVKEFTTSIHSMESWSDIDLKNSNIELKIKVQKAHVETKRDNVAKELKQAEDKLKKAKEDKELNKERIKEAEKERNAKIEEFKNLEKSLQHIPALLNWLNILSSLNFEYFLPTNTITSKDRL